MRLKLGARIRGLRTEILFAICVADKVYLRYTAEAVITSGVDGKHSRGSIHYMGGAIDLRTRNVKGREQIIRDDIADRLGADFDVVLEKDHIHIEYQPKVE
jgi:hypothetical protein